MANQAHLDLLKQGISAWNHWRTQNKKVRPNLSGADLTRANLNKADLTRANLTGADLTEANLIEADLTRANLTGVDLSGADLEGADLTRANLSGAVLSSSDRNSKFLLFIKADLTRANLTGADLSGAVVRGVNLSGAVVRGVNLSRANLSGQDLSNMDLSGANLSGTDLTRANLSGQDLSNMDLSGANLSRANLSEVNLRGADLSGANLSGQDLSNMDLSGANLSGTNLSKTLLIGTNFTEAILSDCTIYGIAAWNVQLENAIQKNLIITQEGEAIITVDNVKVAQFIYLMLNNQEIRDVIETLTTKSVLILGRFTPERKAILDALREALRTHNYLPILFDFDQPSTQTIRETVRTLAHLSHFVIADLTEPSSIPLELETMIPTLPISVQPIIATSEKEEFSMFSSLSIRYHWVLPIYRYADLDSLLITFDEKVLAPAEQKAQALALELRKV